MVTQSQLTTQFYQAFDASQISSLLERLSTLSELERRKHPHYLAEGLHFQSFSLSAHPLPLTLKVAKNTFLNKGTSAINRWRKAIQDLKRIDCTSLIPPLEVVQHQSLVALVMPLGRPIGNGRSYSKSMDELLYETSQSLGRAGLVLDDYPQLVECGGTTFIHDWSDLQLVS